MMKKHNHHHADEHKEDANHDEHKDHDENKEHDEKVTYKEDPHTWTSPENVKIMAKNIYDTLVQVDSSNKEYYLNNYNNFVNEINQTDKKIKEIFTKIPKDSKFMVFHPAWGYFAKNYNLIQFPVEVEGKEPKPKILKEIIEEAKKENIKAIFTQSEFSDKSAKVIADELKIKVIKETPLATNWSQNLIHVANTIANNN
jgi:zinc transport system substrate-binding protein